MIFVAFFSPINLLTSVLFNFAYSINLPLDNSAKNYFIFDVNTNNLR